MKIPPLHLRGIPVLLILTAMLAGNSCNPMQKADLILYNAAVYTVDDNFSKKEALAVKDGKIAGVGTSGDIRARFTADRNIDLEGRFVYPGLIDAHCHFLGYGLSLMQADLTGTSSFGEIIGILKAGQKEFPSEWILGRGWDQNDWELKEFPTRDMLDEAFPGKPVLLRRIDGHAAIASTAALDLAGVDETTEVEGGSLIKENGKLTGLLVDNAIDLVGQILPGPTPEETAAALLKAQENCFAVGLTSVQDAGLSYGTIDLIDRLNREGRLKMRIYAMLSPGKENYEHYMFRGIFQTDHLSVRSVKLYADGALGSRGALLLEPYSDDPGNFGLSVSAADFLREQCRLAWENGYQVNTHCIGDSANRLMLELYAGFLKGKNDLRWRIEHAQVVNKDDFQRFGDYSIIPSIQSTHCTSDMFWAVQRLGEERIGGAYAYKSLMEQNGWIPNGSDFPVENINPLYGYYALFARKDLQGFPEGGYRMEDALSREDAFRAMTIWAAGAAFEEELKGSLEPGKFADFIVTETDLLTMDPDSIPHAAVWQTWSGGERVYPAKQE